MKKRFAYSLMFILIIAFMAMAACGNEENKVKVIFDSNGGSEVKTQEVEYNTTAAEPADPSLLGHDFLYWSEEGSEVEFDFSTKIKSDITLFANWQLSEYTISLDKQEGTGGSTSVTATWQTPMPTATAPTREGYTFAGYYDATSDGIKYYNADMTSAKDWDKDSDATLYARWLDENYYTQGLSFTLINDETEYSVSKGSLDSTIEEIFIPKLYNGISVTTIEESAFAQFSSLTKIKIPNSVTIIGINAFSYCSSLTEIIIPDSVTTIGEGAFSHCTSLSSITLSNSLISIQERAFAYCSSLTSITIPSSVNSIRDSAFSSCDSLVSVYIERPFSEGTISLGIHVFTYSTNLENIYFPDAESVEEYKITGNWYEYSSIIKVKP